MTSNGSNQIFVKIAHGNTENNTILSEFQVLNSQEVHRNW